MNLKGYLGSLPLKGLAVTLLLVATWALTLSEPAAQTATRCTIFTETGGGVGGYTVCDDEQARFLSAYEHWGVTRIGYPISRRYHHDGFVTQAFQKAIMQWRPDSGTVNLVNIFDDMNRAGLDDMLNMARQTPRQLPAGWDQEQSFERVTAARQALLAARPAFQTSYFAADDPLTFYGLPTSHVEDMGNHYAIRLQRTVLQEWKEPVPWAAAGEVTVANGGEIARALGLIPQEALEPLPPAQLPALTPTPSPSPEPVYPPAGSAGTIYLTFDDGPDPVVTPQILDILRQYNARATFFVQGGFAQAYPFMLVQMYGEGHGVANHTLSPASLRGISYQGFLTEVQSTGNVLGGYNSWCLRPPYGETDAYTYSNASALGYRVVMWDTDSWDWRRPGVSAIVSNVVDRVHPGAVVLMHDGGGERSQTLAALPLILDELSRRGYAFEAVCR